MAIHGYGAGVCSVGGDMAHKQGIALREAREAEYWLRMLLEAGMMTDRIVPLRREAGELVAILTVSVKKLRQE